MAEVSGIVNEIKARSTRVGDMYDLVVNGTSYGNGKYAPRGVKVGDFVTFSFETKVNGQYTNHNIVPKTLRVEEKPSAAAVESAKAETRVVVGAQDKRQETISKQANMNTAISLVNLALQNGAVKLPAKPQDAYTAINTLVFEAAATLYRITTGDDWTIDLPEDGVSKKKTAAPVENVADDEYDN